LKKIGRCFWRLAYAQDLETEALSLDEAKASSRKIRQAGKTVSNRSIFEEVRDAAKGGLPVRARDTFLTQKKNRKERKIGEQAQVRSATVQPKPIEPEAVEPAPVCAELEIERPTVLDYDQLREDYGWD
jgi:putative transposase